MARRKDSNSIFHHVYMSPGERDRIVERARLAGLSVSAFLRLAGLGRPIRSVLDYDVVRDLAKINGDQSRLVELLKRWLEDPSARDAPAVDAHRLLERIDALQERLIDVVSRV